MSFLKPIADIVRFSAKIIDKAGRVIYTDESSKRVKRWYNDPKSRFYKTDFDLNENSVVFDLGGFEGQWASDIYAKYNCEIYIFEPVSQYAEEIKERFKLSNKIKVYPFGLFNENKKEYIAIQGEGSSILNKRESSEKTEIKLVRFSDFIKEQKVEKIDLIKINIEGAEYKLLEDIIENEYIERVDNFLIQFHDFFPNAKDMMSTIHSKLKQTHDKIFYHEFVWEAWKKK